MTFRIPKVSLSISIHLGRVCGVIEKKRFLLRCSRGCFLDWSGLIGWTLTGVRARPPHLPSPIQLLVIFAANPSRPPDIFRRCENWSLCHPLASRERCTIAVTPSNKKTSLGGPFDAFSTWLPYRSIVISFNLQPADSAAQFSAIVMKSSSSDVYSVIFKES